MHYYLIRLYILLEHSKLEYFSVLLLLEIIVGV